MSSTKDLVHIEDEPISFEGLHRGDEVIHPPQVNCLIGLDLEQTVVTRRSWLPIVGRVHVEYMHMCMQQHMHGYQMPG